jgi:uncharacterized protein YbjT (DUF2867 family)
MILVAGGSGRLGSLVVSQLAARGDAVRVLTREPERASHLAGIPGLSVVTGDVRDSASMRRAADGCSVVVSAVQGFATPGAGVSPATVDRDGNRHLVDAAVAVGAAFVLMSVVGAAPHSQMELFRMKHAAEEHARRVGLPLTVVRATAFMELWVEILRKTAGRTGRPVVFGHGRNPMNFVSVGDVAALTTRAVTDEHLAGGTYEIGGPETLTMTELARRVSGGREPKHVPPAVLSLAAATIGRLRPPLGRQMHAALVMDRVDLTFDAAPLRTHIPDLPCTTIDDALSATSSEISSDG